MKKLFCTLNFLKGGSSIATSPVLEESPDPRLWLLIIRIITMFAIIFYVCIVLIIFIYDMDNVYVCIVLK